MELETSEVEKLRIEVKKIMGESQAFLLDATRSMLVEVKRDNGRLESGTSEGSAAVWESPKEAEPTAGGQSPAGEEPTAVRETRDAGLRKFSQTGHGETAVPVEVGPMRGYPDQQRRAGEWDLYPGGERGGGYDLPLDIWLSSTPLYHHLVGRNMNLPPGQETLGITPKE